jgi:hypothetical protein
MGQFIQVSGDYNIKAGEGATITLDTGAGVGETRVTGNLVVEGDTLYVSVENLNVDDNIITINYGESPTHPGVTLRYSGIEVERGSLENVSLLWDENDDTWNFKEGAGYATSRLRLKEILTNSDTDRGDLTVIGTGSGVAKVFGTIDYAQEIVSRAAAGDPEADDILTNKKYVDDAIQTNPTFQILRSDTRVAAFDIGNPVDSGLFPIGPYFVQPAESLVGVSIDNNIIAQFFRNRVQIAGLNFFLEDPTPDNPLIPDATVLQTVNTNGNIKLETNGTGKVEITYALQLDNPGTTPAAVSNASLVYGGTVGPGSTGVYFRNTAKNDELISKSKALVFSMIF